MLHGCVRAVRMQACGRVFGWVGARVRVAVALGPAVRQDITNNNNNMAAKKQLYTTKYKKRDITHNFAHVTYCCRVLHVQ